MSLLPLGSAGRMPKMDHMNARPEWEGRGAGYLNTAAYGLPPRAAVDAATEWVEQWRDGTARYTDWLPPTDTARASFARLVGVDADQVATGATASQLVGTVAAAVPDGALVIADEREFTSLLYPFLAQADRGVRVELVARDHLAETVAERGAVVAFSLVSSADGTLAPHEDIRAAAAGRGAWTVVDASQACGWLDVAYAGFDVVVCPAFKWLHGPRGTAFLAVAARRLPAIRPSAAGWWASEGAQHAFGGPLRLAGTARRLDISPVWNSWGATAAALATLEAIELERIGAHVVGLADRLRAGLGLPAGDTPIVEVVGDGVADTLTAAGLVVTATPRGARLAFGLSTGVADVDRALEVLHA
jgi:selenocysteine lyase/cysteine desulfurase